MSNLPTVTTSEWPPLSPGLSSLLGGGDPQTGIEEVARNPAMLAEAAAAYPAMREAATRPASENEIAAILLRRVATLYPQPERTPEAHAAWLGEYCDALAGLPAVQIEGGMLAHVTSGEREDDGKGKRFAEFMPKPWRLLALAKDAANRRAMMAGRCLAALKLAEKRGRAGAVELRTKTPEEVAAVRKMLGDYPHKVDAKKPPKAEPRSMSAALPEGRSITPDLARQRGLE